MSALAGMAIFAILACVLLAGTRAPYLIKTDELSLFVSDGRYFSDCMLVPGGALTWCATFITQFFHYPWLGTAVMTLTLLGLWLAVYRAFRLPGRAFLYAGVVPAMLLAAYLMAGYLIYTIKTPGFAYMGILGCLAATGIYALYRLSDRMVWRLAVLAAAAAMYMPLGFYALLGMALCVVADLRRLRGSWPCVAAAVVLMVAVPRLVYYFGDTHLMYARMYISGLPRYGADSAVLWLPYIVAFAAMCVFALIGRRAAAAGSAPCGMRGILSAAAVYLCSLAAVPLLAPADPHLDSLLRMDIASEQGDYAAALEASRDAGPAPTRALGLYTHMSLYHLGQAGDSLFTYPMADTEYRSPNPGFTMRAVCTRELLYKLGRVNDCYRWCMEDMVEYGPRAEYLKYMVKCALVNGEAALARRYLDILDRTLFHSDWARRYRRYADDPSLMDAEPEFTSIRPLMAYHNTIGGDGGGRIESYLSAAVASMEGGPRELVELSLQFNLVRKDIAGFWPRFMLYARTHDRLPRHYQEAAVLFSALEQQVDWRRFDIDPEVVRSFGAFMEMARRNSRFGDDANREAFKPVFGDTYWYYYFFIKDLKTL